MHELGMILGATENLAVFRLKDNSNIGVKIRLPYGKNDKQFLGADMKKTKQLKEKGMSVVDYAGVIKVKIPENFKSMIEQCIDGGVVVDKKVTNQLIPGEEYFALSVKLVENDLIMIDARNLPYLFEFQKRIGYTKGVMIKHRHKYGISVNSIPALYSKNAKKIYFLDVDSWEVNNNTIYELGEMIGAGAFSAFFRVKGKSRLGARIRYNLEDSNSMLDSWNEEKLNQLELERAKILKENNIQIPKYVGETKIIVPEHIEETFNRWTKRQDIKPKRITRSNPEEPEYDFPSWYRDLKIQFFRRFRPGNILPAIIIEIIEDDLTSINFRRVNFFYNKEREKLENLGILVRDSHSAHNCLWSEKRNKVYLIDFEGWNFPEKLPENVKKRRAWQFWKRAA